MVVALLALFVAMGGVSYAAAKIGSKQIKNNSVRGKDIRNGTVAGKDLKNGSTTGKDVKNDSLTGDDILESSLGQVPSAKTADTVGPNGVNTTAIQDNAVTTTKIANNAVTNTKIANDAVTAAKIADNSVGSGELGPVTTVTQTVAIGTASGNTASHTTPCPAGTQVISGGAFPSAFASHMVSNTVNGNGWFGAFQNVAAIAGAPTITVRVTCLLPQ
jgi:hypothetical protein